MATKTKAGPPRKTQREAPPVTMRSIREDDFAADMPIEPKRARRNTRGARIDRATAASVTKSGAGRTTRKRPAGAGARAGKATGTTHRGGTTKRGRATSNAAGGKARTRKRR